MLLRFGSLRGTVAVASALAFVACAESAADPAAADPKVDVPSIAQVGDPIVPVQDISIGDQFLEIDDLDLLGSGDRDANLCSLASQGQGYATCPNSLYSSISAFNADNPNFPGPNPAFPATLGVEADYIDWADLDAAQYLDPFADSDVFGTDDDIFSPDSCYTLGNSPSKANLSILGFAANADYLYLLSERVTSNGQEEHHYYFTKSPPEFAFLDSCNGDTWLWSLEDGDVEVTLRYQSTAGLPEADVTVRLWDGGSVSGVKAEDLVTSTDWIAAPGTNLAYVALNVNGDDHKALPDEDLEFDFDGSELDSGIKAEIAIDIAQVFGAGCGLRRTVAVISTAAGPGGRNDDLKDIAGPVTIQTGTLTTDLTLYESCDEEFGYLVELAFGGDGGGVIPLPDSDFDVDLVYDCGSGEVVVADPFLPDGTIAVPVDVAETCSVRVEIVGSGEFTGCEAEETQEVQVFPILEASGELDQNCDGTFSWNTTISGGSGDTDLLWTFDINDGGIASSATSTEANGSAVLAAAGIGSASVDAILDVSDADLRNTAFGEETCTVTPTISGIIANRPLVVELVPTTGDGTCPVDDVETVQFDAEIHGGSGDWTLAWEDDDENGSDAELDATCESTVALIVADQDDTLSCSFGLGSGFCANGEVSLEVTDADPECLPDSDSISAVRTSSIDVTPDP